MDHQRVELARRQNEKITYFTAIRMRYSKGDPVQAQPTS